MKAKEREAQKKRIIEGLGVSAEEAEAILDSDDAIDHNEPQDFDLPLEKLKDARKFAHTGTRTVKQPTVYNFNQRERKADPTKGGFIQFLYEALSAYEGIENLTIANAEKLITFSHNGDNFELDLRKKRKPKGEK